MIEWDLFVLIGVVIIALAKLLDIIFIYSRNDIHNKFIEYWIYLSDINFRESINISLVKTNNILSFVVGKGKDIYRNLAIISFAYAVFFFNVSSNFVGSEMIYEVFIPHIIWSILSFILSILLTKYILYKAIQSKSLKKIFSFILLDIVLLIMLLSLNPSPYT